MRNMWKGAVPALFLVATLAAQAQSLSASDRDKAMKYLESTRQGVLDATQGLSPAQWNFKPAPDRWSVAEVTEHIASAEDYLRGMIVEKVMVAPARPAGENVAEIDEMILKTIPDRSHKAQAPEPLKPSNRYGTPEGSLKHFQEARATTETFLSQTSGLRDHAVDSPLGKKVDGYEWILFIAAHSDRHTKQILEVKADPNF
ncbi:MAG TPA: DinB family protein, partial [Anaerolineales bacterium]|nr:DinB family protein [Anaerolineales bacterium]